MSSQGDDNGQQFDGVKIEAQSDGTLAVTFSEQGKPILTADLTQAQAAQLAALLLGGARNAHIQSGQQLSTGAQLVTIDPLATHGFAFVTTKVGGRYAISVRFGSALITFAVDRQHLRDLARTVLETSYRDVGSVPSGALLREVLSDFFTGLKSCGGVFKARFKAESRRRAISLSSKVSGRSLRVFRAIDIVPGMKPFSYPPSGECCPSSEILRH